MMNAKISRENPLIHKVVMVDGQPGCGKTMLSSIIASFEKVELITYIFELEFICRLYSFNKITKDATLAMIKMLIDNKIYQTMMGRDTNFRYNDISSIFNYRDPKKYFKRIFDVGDEAIPNKITKEKPILNVTSHDLLINVDVLFKALGKKLVFIEIVRHPLYMLIQQTLNMENLTNNPRDIEIYFMKKKVEYPYFVHGWEKKFRNFNSIEKAIYAIFIHTKKNDVKRKKILKKYHRNFISIPFEDFVLYPTNYIKKINKLIGTNFSKDTHGILSNHRVPRKKIADSIPLDIYKRCGWKPPKKNLTEKEELNLRRSFAVKNKVSKEMLELLDKLSRDYEKKYFKKIKIN